MSPSSARRHLIIPDTHVRPGSPLWTMNAAANAILEYRPDVVVHLGDHWDMPSLNRHSAPGSADLEGRRISDDVAAGNTAMRTLMNPIISEVNKIVSQKKKQWHPRMVYLKGNHDDHADRAARDNPALEGVVGSHLFQLDGWEVHQFLEIAEIDGIAYSHYFQGTHSAHPIGGTITNRLAKIGRSFIQGHQQGFLYGTQQYPGSVRRHGLVAGSYYDQTEAYRGPQGEDEWRGIIVLNEVRNGDYCIMPLTMQYLREKFT